MPTAMSSLMDFFAVVPPWCVEGPSDLRAMPWPLGARSIGWTWERPSRPGPDGPRPHLHYRVGGRQGSLATREFEADGCVGRGPAERSEPDAVPDPPPRGARGPRPAGAAAG